MKAKNKLKEYFSNILEIPSKIHPTPGSIKPKMNKDKWTQIHELVYDQMFELLDAVDVGGVRDSNKEREQLDFFSNNITELIKQLEEIGSLQEKKIPKPPTKKDKEKEVESEVGNEWEGDDIQMDPIIGQIQKALNIALKGSQKLGDPKLIKQVGNTLTFLTRMQVQQGTDLMETEKIIESNISKVKKYFNQEQLQWLRDAFGQDGESYVEIDMIKGMMDDFKEEGAPKEEIELGMSIYKIMKSKNINAIYGLNNADEYLNEDFLDDDDFSRLQELAGISNTKSLENYFPKNKAKVMSVLEDDLGDDEIDFDMNGNVNDKDGIIKDLNLTNGNDIPDDFKEVTYYTTEGDDWPIIIISNYGEDVHQIIYDQDLEFYQLDDNVFCAVLYS